MSIQQSRKYFNNNKNLRKFCQIVDEYERPINGNRVVVHSIEDVKRLASESFRARLMSQIINGVDSQKEFPSYYSAPSPIFELPHSLLSHTLAMPTHPKHDPVTMYPSITQDLRWSPYVETTTMSQTDTALKCRCDKCRTANCPNKISSVSNKSPNQFKDNIVTYTNQQTMTTTLVDASCGPNTYSYIPLTYSPETIDAAVTASDIAVRDPGDRICVPFSKCPAVPILKNKSKAIMYKGCADPDRCWERECQMRFDHRHKPERDIDNSEVYCDPSSMKSMKCLKPKKKKSCGQTANTYPPCDRNRKILYNEGISDTIPTCSPTRTPCSEADSECGRTFFNRWNSCIDDEEVIPYSHKKSKYHQDCKKSHNSPSKHCELRQPPELKPLFNCPPVIRRQYTRRPSQSTYRSQCINLPRKMLTSEKDIEAFIKTRKFEE